MHPLVKDLVQQCSTCSVPWEIICVDDGSDAYFREINQCVAEMPGVSYEILPHNIGRAAVRNLLARKAQFPYLLFMDCDSRVVRTDYLQQYIARMKSQTVLCGGRVYPDSPPENKQLLLHWKFGRKREQVPASQRAVHPHHAFMSNNFVVPRQCFLDIQMEERLIGYGHEDTLFGMELLARGIAVEHLENPLEHSGLETAEVLIQKNDDAMRNLAWLMTNAAIPIETRLAGLVRKLKRYRLEELSNRILHSISPLLKMLLRSSIPPLWALDAYKLGRLLRWLNSERLSSYKADYRG